jgi:hypothetical protein
VGHCGQQRQGCLPLHLSRINIGSASIRCGKKNFFNDGCRGHWSKMVEASFHPGGLRMCEHRFDLLELKVLTIVTCTGRLYQ